MKAYVGIDPGKSGCFAILRDDQEIEFYDWPKDNNPGLYFRNLAQTCQSYDIRLAVLERVHAMPKQGVTSMFNFGLNFGMWQAFLLIHGMKHILVPPQTWMKGMVMQSDGRDSKSRVRAVVTRLFPHADIYGPRGSYKDGRADALMMAYFASLKDPQKSFVQKTKPRRRS